MEVPMLYRQPVAKCLYLAGLLDLDLRVEVPVCSQAVVKNNPVVIRGLCMRRGQCREYESSNQDET